MLASMWDVQGSTSAIFKLFPSKKSPHTHSWLRSSSAYWDLELAV
jgi:hypothetical protein